MALKNDKFNGEDRENLIVEQWSKAVEMADTTIDKRINSTNVYITIEAALIAVMSFVKDWINYVVPIVGITVAVIWLLSIRSYKSLSKIKYTVINEIEEMLPIKPFKYEWELLIANKEYKHVTTLERCLPIIFGVLFAVILIGVIFFGKQVAVEVGGAQ